MPLKVTTKDCKLTYKVELDKTPIKGNVLFYGIDEYDEKIEQEVIRQVAAGNIWAWSYITLTLEFRGNIGVAYLGGCVYNDEEHFKRDPCFYDLLEEALEDLNKQLENVYEESA